MFGGGGGGIDDEELLGTDLLFFFSGGCTDELTVDVDVVDSNDAFAIFLIILSGKSLTVFDPSRI